MRIVGLNGGLGNWLFQIAFVEYLKQFGVNPKIEIFAKSPHSKVNYFDNILQYWRNQLVEINRVFNRGKLIFREDFLQRDNWEQIVRSSQSLTIIGFFQNHNYITPSFLENIHLPKDSLSRHPGIQDTVFIHIRGCDYPSNPLYNFNLDSYYERAVQLFPTGTTFSIFTNDIDYANTKSFLTSVPHVFIHEGELDSLYLMTQCSGGICANSSFSWWGAYLNRQRKLILPSKWYTNTSLFAGGYYFKEATILDL